MAKRICLFPRIAQCSANQFQKNSVLQHVLPKNHDVYTNQDSSLHCCYKSNVNANVGRHAIPQNLQTLHTNKAESLVDTDKKNAAKFNQLRGCTQIVEHLLGWHCLHRHKNCVHCQLWHFGHSRSPGQASCRCTSCSDLRGSRSLHRAQPRHGHGRQI